MRFSSVTEKLFVPCAHLGGNWNNGDNCGSRGLNWNNSPLNLNNNIGFRAVSEYHKLRSNSHSAFKLIRLTACTCTFHKTTNLQSRVS